MEPQKQLEAQYWNQLCSQLEDQFVRNQLHFQFEIQLGRSQLNTQLVNYFWVSLHEQFGQGTEL